jgi:hypothetical protein
MMRNAADTALPIIFPVFVKSSNLRDIAFAVAATTIDVTITMLPLGQPSFSGNLFVSSFLRAMSQRKPSSYRNWFLSTRDKPSGHQVDSRYVIRIQSMSKTQNP